MAKAKKPAKTSRIASRKKPSKPKQIPHYNKCKALWERRREERKAQFAEAQRKGKPDDHKDDWKTGFVTPDPVQSAASGGDWLVDPLKLPVDAGRFFATMRILGEHLQDRRYHDLHRELIMSNLIDRKTGKWSRYGTTLVNPFTQDMCAMIEESIATRDFKEREAIADAVAELGLDSPSFSTACKRVKRLLDAYRKAVGQKPR